MLISISKFKKSINLSLLYVQGEKKEQTFIQKGKISCTHTYANIEVSILISIFSLETRMFNKVKHYHIFSLRYGDSLLL